KPKGLQLSAAQWKAYGAAYSASAKAGYATLAAQNRAIALHNAANTLQASRLQAALSLQKKVAVAHANARTAAIASYAASQTYRQSILAHQNIALKTRIYADFERHVLLAGRLQYIYQGEKVYAHNAVMRTLTSQQALNTEEQRFARASKTAKAAARSVAPGKASTGAKSAQALADKAAVNTIKAQAKAAGMAAALAVPPAPKKKTAAKKSRTAPRPQTLAPLKFLHGFGNPDGEDCVAAAIANHLLCDKGIRLSPAQYLALTETVPDGSSIEDALFRVMVSPPWKDGPNLIGYCEVPFCPSRVLVLGYEAEEGPHAAASVGNGFVLSWGEVLQLKATQAAGAQIEECWNLAWIRHRTTL
ncbi:MAG TPA: hypothetical protein VHE33_09025, partial [Acidobacteriaceae bacterium]|nr:hypothetical protein [Acidobacteriaceae bacterium]